MDGDNNYVVGAGKLYFDPFLDGTKTPSGLERYLGNTTAIARAIAVTKLDHYSSDYKIKVKDATVDLQQDDTGTFSTDNVDLDNIALWFGATKDASAQAAAAAVTDVFTTESGLDYLGKWLQLGTTDVAPYGARKAGAITSVKIGATAMAAAAAMAIDPTNYTADLDNARIFIKYESAAMQDADIVLEVTYSLLVDARTIVVQNGAQQEGTLRYIADNRIGDNNDFFWPDAKLTANGDYALKGDTWATLQFNVEFLKRDDTTEVQYVTAAVGAS